jgi:hypothetical protein
MRKTTEDTQPQAVATLIPQRYNYSNFYSPFSSKSKKSTNHEEVKK